MRGTRRFNFGSLKAMRGKWEVRARLARICVQDIPTGALLSLFNPIRGLETRNCHGIPPREQGSFACLEEIGILFPPFNFRSDVSRIFDSITIKGRGRERLIVERRSDRVFSRFDGFVRHLGGEWEEEVNGEPSGWKG